jgi:chromosome segregation ATPase
MNEPDAVANLTIMMEAFQKIASVLRRDADACMAELDCFLSEKKELAGNVTKAMAELSREAKNRCELQDRLAAIEAAKKAQEPRDPLFLSGGLQYENELKAWGRQGWDAAAALRVELVRAQERIAEHAAALETANDAHLVAHEDAMRYKAEVEQLRAALNPVGVEVDLG